MSGVSEELCVRHWLRIIGDKISVLKLFENQKDQINEHVWILWCLIHLHKSCWDGRLIRNHSKRLSGPNHIWNLSNSWIKSYHTKPTLNVYSGRMRHNQTKSVNMSRIIPKFKKISEKRTINISFVSGSCGTFSRWYPSFRQGHGAAAQLLGGTGGVYAGRWHVTSHDLNLIGIGVELGYHGW